MIKIVEEARNRTQQNDRDKRVENVTDSPCLASLILPLVMSKYLGDSGHKGSNINCSTAGTKATPSKKGHPSVEPKIPDKPRT